MNPEPRIHPDSTPSRGSALRATPNPEAPICRGRGAGVSSKSRSRLSPADLQDARDAEYATAYRDWLATLPPDERARLAAQGLGEPDTKRHTSQHDDETVMSLTESPDIQPDDQVEEDDERAFAAAQSATSAIPTPAADSSPSPGGYLAAGDILASFCARIRAHPNPLLAFDAACFASGLMDIEGLSETALAKRHGVTRAAFSRLVVQWSQTFALPPSRGMRSKRARQSYRKSRLNHLSKLKSTAHHVH